MQSHTTRLKSKVYLTRVDNWLSHELIGRHLLRLWGKIEETTDSFLITQGDFLAIKLTFGEEGGSGYIKPEWLIPLISELKKKTKNLFIIETNTLYREERSNAVGHLGVAYRHGYSIDRLGIPIIIGDGLQGRDSQTVSIRGKHLENVKLAKAVCECDAIICLTHVTGHCQTGFAGSLKNIGMGCAARAGKLQQHTRTLPEIELEKCTGCGSCMIICPANAIGIKKKKAILVKERCIGCGECTIVCRYDAIKIKYDENAIKLQEKMVEYVLGVETILKSKIIYINFLWNITKNCDCMSKNEAPITGDVGIICSEDPCAVDKASMDIIGCDIFRQQFHEIDPEVQIRHAEKINLGSSQYELEEV